MKKQIVNFVIDKDLDIENHLIGLWTYEKKLHSLVSASNERYEKLIKLSLAKRKRFIAKSLDWRYSGPKKKLLLLLAKDVNTAWARMEKDFIRRIEKIHKRRFSFRAVRGVLSSADRFGYNLEKHWFATSMFRNTFAATDTAMHELMHFMFLKHYLKTCRGAGLSEQQIWDIKESFTTLLNIEFDDLRFNWDGGYPEHKELRAVIKQSWLKYHAFDKALADAITAVEKSREGAKR
jgi:hypothetical protein